METVRLKKELFDVLVETVGDYKYKEVREIMTSLTGWQAETAGMKPEELVEIPGKLYTDVIYIIASTKTYLSCYQLINALEEDVYTNAKAPTDTDEQCAHGELEDTEFLPPKK